jgi:hypothetical protein
LCCQIVASDRRELDALSQSQEFLHDWHMKALVEQAREKLSALPEGRKYCLKIPALLGGEYGGENLGTVPLVELIRFSGDVARRIKDLPEGSTVELKIVD